MCTFYKKIIIVVLTTLVFLTSANAAPIISGVPAKTQAEQFMQVYKILMATKLEKERKSAALKASFSLTPQKKEKRQNYSKRLHVTATAYTSHAAQTDSTPNIAAWGDRLRPGMKAIAVSRDLLNEYGLKHKQKVRIKGLNGEYVVLDKMNKRWRKKIDIYMGMNKRKAFQWGRRKVEILWD